MNVIAKTWFSTLDGSLIGVVVVQPQFGLPKAYIGGSGPHNQMGYNEEMDAACIAQMGAKFPAIAARALFPHIPNIVD